MAVTGWENPSVFIKTWHQSRAEWRRAHLVNGSSHSAKQQKIYCTVKEKKIIHSEKVVILGRFIQKKLFSDIRED